MPLDSIFDTLPNGWEPTTLGEVCQAGGLIQTGPFGSQLHASDYVPVGVPSIMPVNIGDNRIVADGVARIREADAERLGRHRVRPGDVVYSRRGDVERRALVRDAESGWLCGTGCLLVRFGEGIDPRFASYYLGHPHVRAWIVRHAVGDTMPNLNTSIMSAVPFVRPPRNEQIWIADILSSLDDKIECNRRMNRTLEAMARAVFRSWFVDFDPVRARADGRTPAGMDAATAALFPDHFEDSELGKVPAGWRVASLGDYCAKITDGSHRSPPSVEHGWAMASVKDMTDWGITVNTCRRISEAEYSALVANDCQPIQGDVLLAKDGATCLETACEYRQDDAIVLLSSVAILRPRHLAEAAYLHLWLTSDSTKDYLRDGFVSGSAIPRVVLKDLKRARILRPSDPIIHAFTRAVEPLRAILRANVNNSSTLAALRDTLLPKLISGELRIPDAERLVGSAP